MPRTRIRLLPLRGVLFSRARECEGDSLAEPRATLSSLPQIPLILAPSLSRALSCRHFVALRVYDGRVSCGVGNEACRAS